LDTSAAKKLHDQNSPQRREKTHIGIRKGKKRKRRKRTGDNFSKTEELSTGKKRGKQGLIV